MTTQNTDTALDQLFEKARSTPAPDSLSFDQIVESAELLQHPSELRELAKQIARANLLAAERSLVIKAASKALRISKADVKESLDQLSDDIAQDFARELSTATLNRHFAGGAHLLRYARTFWMYTGTHWIPRDDDQIGWYINQTISDIPRPRQVNESAAINAALNLLGKHCARQTDPFATRDDLLIINCANCELHIDPDTGTTTPHPHSHESFQTYCLSTAYEPYATCPKFDHALRQVFAHPDTAETESLARHFEEFMGYAIQPSREIPAFFLLKGQGSNGKSKLMQTVTEHLMGESASATMKISNLGVDRFSTSKLVGKLLVFEDDMDKNTSLPDGILKAISERKKLDAEFKGKDSFSFICRALPVFSSNHWPRTTDLSYGLQRRAQVIPFKRQFKGADVDRRLFPTIWREEMPGVLNRALQGLQRVLQRQAFSPPESCQRAFDLWMQEVNPVKAFMSEYLEPAQECAIPWKEIWARFDAWQKEEGLRYEVAKRSAKSDFKSLGVIFVKRDGYDWAKGWGWKSRTGLQSVGDED